MNRMITIRLFWMLLSWQYWLPWSVHETLKVMNILMGMHIGFTKYCCFLCLWEPLQVLLRITMKSNIRPQETHMFLEWSVFRSSASSISRSC